MGNGMRPRAMTAPTGGDALGAPARYGARARRAAALLGCCAAWVALGGGCGAPAVSLQEGPREYVATDYESVLDRWTRTESLILYSELERALTVTATFESWDFRWAYVIRYANDYRLTVAQRKQLLDQALDETRHAHQFFVALYGGNRRHNDLTQPSSAWIVRLIDSTGNETAPSEIVAIKKPTALEQRYYPYNTVWRQAFRIRFPVTSPDGRPTVSPQATWLGLRFAGAKGNTDLTWDIEQREDNPERKPSEAKPSDSKPSGDK